MNADICKAIADLLEEYKEEFAEKMLEIFAWSENSEDYGEDESGDPDVPFISRTSTFEERGMLTMNSGFCVKFSDGKEFTFEMVRYR